jgi:hypothetical protein
MTEQDWLASTDPQKMLEFLRGKASDRKLRLFAVACCRKIWHLMIEESFRRAIEIAELLADGMALTGDMDAELTACEEAVPNPDDLFDQGAAAVLRAEIGWAAGMAATYVSFPDGSLMSLVDGMTATANDAAAELDPSASHNTMGREMAEQAQLVRDIFGNPFRQMAFESSWRTPTVIRLAQTLYDRRVIDRMSSMADALEEVRCTNADILAHCRAPGPHVRGCWAVDLILDRS